MNISDIIMRDMLDEDRRQRERDAAEAAAKKRAGICWGDVCAVPWLGLAMWAAVIASGMGAAFAGGMWYQAKKALAADMAQEISATGCGCISAD